MTTTPPATVQRYNTTAMTLHWLVAALLLVNVFVGFLGADAKGAEADRLMGNHKSIGITLFGLVVLRLLWRLARRPPPLPAAYAPAEKAAAHGVHWLLYLVMLALPITGYIHDSAWKEAATHPNFLFGLVHVPRLGLVQALDPATKEHVHALFGAAHVYAGYALYALVALHLAAVAKHQAFDGEAELERMLPTGDPPKGVR